VRNLRDTEERDREKHTGRDTEERWRGRDRGMCQREQTEGKRQWERDGGEETERMRWMGRDKG
jgi:hypothetical protein